jgi:hypothetical protein
VGATNAQDAGKQGVMAFNAGSTGRFGRFRVLHAATAAGFALSACTSLDFNSDPNVGPCPMAASLYEASRLVKLDGPERHENVAVSAEIEGVSGFCRYTGDNPITMSIDIDLALARGPKATGDTQTYNYWVAVARRDRAVLGKEAFSVEVKFPRGENVVRRRERVEGIVIPRASETVSGTNFEVLVGFDLSPEQLEFNRAGKRFTMQVK